MSESTAPLAVVTGASTGIGRALAQQFVDHGFDLVICADEPEIVQVGQELARGGRLVTAEQVDLSEPDSVTALVSTIEATGRPVAAAALNVGIGANGRFHETDLDDNLVREIGLAAGVVDVKVCAIDEVWSGLKFVRRLADRT